MILLGTSHSGLYPLKWLISTAGSSWEIIQIEKKWVPPWSWSCNMTWHDGLIFSFFDNSCLPYLLPPFSLQGFSYRCDYHFIWGIIYLLYLMAKVLSFIIIITSACHYSSKAAPPAMDMWTKLWQMGHSLCTNQIKVSYNWTGLNSLI